MTVNFTTWKGITDGQKYDIPDDAELYYLLGSRSDNTVVESVQQATGTSQGSTNVPDSNFPEGYREDGDGDSDYIVVENGVGWHQFLSEHFDAFTIEFSFKTTTTNDGFFFGVETGEQETFRSQINLDSGELALSASSGDFNAVKTDGANINDGDEHIAHLKKVGEDESEWEIAIDGSDVSVSVESTGNSDSWDGGATDDFYILAGSAGQELGRWIDASMGHLAAFPSVLGESRIADRYQSMPFSE